MKTLLVSLAVLSSLVLSTFAAESNASALLRQSGVTGGLAVHIGCGDGHFAAALATGRDTLIVHGLDSDSAKVSAARKYFQTSKASDRLSAEHWRDKTLPYADSLVNLLVIEAGHAVARAEAMRVLAPGGTAFFREGAQWRQETKPLAGANRDWTHYQFDAANNPVGKDPDCGLPRRFQWSGTPLWSAAHESMASLNAMVSANGRVFYIMDEGPRASIQLPSDWQLVARDAYNGAVLWRKPITQWLTRFWPWKSGPAQMPRKLVAIGDCVYAPLDINGPLKQFDARTGNELRTYANTTAAEEFIYTDGILLVQVNPNPPDMAEVEKAVRERRHFSYDGRNRAILNHDDPKHIVAIAADTGKLLWKHDAPKVSPLSLSALKDNVIYHNGSSLVCLNLKTGKQKWISESVQDQRKKLIMYSEEAATVVLHEKAVFYAKDQKMTAVSMADGKTLWSSKWTQNDYRSPVTVMLMQDRVWSMNITSARAPGTFTARDILTGDVLKQFDLPAFKGIGHHRCYKAKASGDYVLLSRSGVEYVNPAKESYDENHWVRGACLYGILPANGMLYSTPHACACYIKGKLNGFTAMTPGPTKVMVADYSMNPIEKGSSYPVKLDTKNKAADWPTYRGDVARSGRGNSPVTTDLKQSWSTALGGNLTSVTIGNGLVFVAQKDRNTVHALKATDGAKAWQFTAGGKVDSPPTIQDGWIYFGSADGCVYCLVASDGSLKWRTRAAPRERRVMSYGRVESTWPVNGSVLVQKGAVYAAAGRSSFLDGGIYVVKIDAETGKVIYNYNVNDLETGQQPPLTSSFDMAGALPDILSGDGERVFMRHLGFSADTLSPSEPAPHAFSPAGYLDDTWWHRIYMVYGDDTKGGYGGWWQAGNKLPAGRLLVHDDKQVYSFGRSFYAGMNAAQFGRGEQYVLAASAKESGKEPDYGKVNQQRKLVGDLKIDWKPIRTTPIKWSEQIPFNVRAMALADQTLFAAGPYGDAVRSADSFTGKRGVRLAAVSTGDGKMLASYAIDALPVWDGLAAAQGRLFMAARDGTVRCFGATGATLKSTLGESIEVLPEKLLESDEEYRSKVREAVGAPQPAKKGKRGKAAPRSRLKGKDVSARFSRVSGGRVVESVMGSRLGSDASQVALALNKLSEPVTTSARWVFSLKVVEGYDQPDYYRNGFFAIGDGPKVDNLVMCGIQFIQGIATIIEGSPSGGKGVRAKLDGDLDRAFGAELSVDLSKQEVVLKVAGQTIRKKLARPLKQITHTGIVTWNAVTDFRLPGGH